jgi:hypothetical protein
MGDNIEAWTAFRINETQTITIPIRITSYGTSQKDARIHFCHPTSDSPSPKLHLMPYTNHPYISEFAIILSPMKGRLWINGPTVIMRDTMHL